LSNQENNSDLSITQSLKALRFSRPESID